MNNRSNEKAEPQDTSLEQMGVIFQPKNLLKTIASQFPGSSAGVEMLNQLDHHKISGRLKTLEESDAELNSKLRKLEQSSPSAPPPVHDWSAIVSKYLPRIVDFAVAYRRANDRRNLELIQVVAHGCLIDAGIVVTCEEALECLHSIAQIRSGKAIMLVGFAWYDFLGGQTDETSGLVICKITKRNEQKWREWSQLHEKYGLGSLTEETDLASVNFSVSPWIGQEIGFLHSGEAGDSGRLGGMMLQPKRFSQLQFDETVISHFKAPRSRAIKSFVTGVLPGRILWTGSPVFSRDGTLLGVIADTEHYKSDSGRRAVIKSLLGNPYFMRERT